MLMNKRFCVHDWQRQYLVSEYFDYSGFKVGIFKCKCRKCGKVKNKKYY